MSDSNLVHVPMEHVQPDVPLPFSVWDQGGNLLLAEGQVLSADQVDSLRARKGMAKPEEILRWRRTVEKHLAEVMRNNREAGTLESFSGNPISERIPQGLTLIRETPIRASIQITSPVATWDAIHLRASSLLNEAENARMFLPRMEALCDAIDKMMHRHPDESLYVLINQSTTSMENYSVHHALLTTAVAWMIANHMEGGVDQKLVDLTLRAGLTMNIAMTQLQNKLALQEDPLSAEQRRMVMTHPVDGVRILRACGVDDERWLDVVEDHHETNDGRGYPAGKKIYQLSTASKIIHQADLFAARLSPRKGRAALAANLAARKAYLGVDGQPDPLGAILVKQLGIYPPGSFVKLANEEIAVVLRRGIMVNTPRVASLTNSMGIAHVKPLLRETSDKTFEIRASLAADAVKVIVNHERMLNQNHMHA